MEGDVMSHHPTIGWGRNSTEWPKYNETTLPARTMEALSIGFYGILHVSLKNRDTAHNVK